MSILIALDAGHGLKTAGKQTPDGIKEWELNDKVRDKVTEILKNYQCEIIHTDNDEGITDESLAERYRKYMNSGADVFVSIHHNAFKSNWSTATGVEVYTDKNPTEGDVRLANLIYGRMVKYIGLKGRGIKKADFYVINQNRIPAVLCEGGFMDGKNDYKIITSEQGQNAYAKAVAEGIIEYMSLKKKTAVKDIYYHKFSGTTASIVDALKQLNIDSSFGNRRKIANANGIKLYLGTASQNTALLNLLKNGKLRRV